MWTLDIYNLHTNIITLYGKYILNQINIVSLLLTHDMAIFTFKKVHFALLILLLLEWIDLYWNKVLIKGNNAILFRILSTIYYLVLFLNTRLHGFTFSWVIYWNFFKSTTWMCAWVFNTHVKMTQTFNSKQQNSTKTQIFILTYYRYLFFKLSAKSSTINLMSDSIQVYNIV